MTGLPVWATVKAAYGALWLRRRPLLRYALVPFVLVAIVDIAGTRLGEAAAEPSADNGPAAWFPLSSALEELTLFLCTLVLIAFAVPCCRLLLLGPAAVAGRWPAGQVYLGMLAFTVLVTLVFDLPLTLLDRQYESAQTWSWLAAEAGLAAVYIWVSVKLVFIYPVICLARRWDLAQRWRETAGNFWRLSAALCVALLPPIAAVLLWAFLFALWPETSYDRIIESVTLAVFAILGAALTVAVTAVAFARLTGFPAEGLRPGRGNRKVVAPKAPGL